MEKKENTIGYSKLERQLCCILYASSSINPQQRAYMYQNIEELIKTEM